MGLEQVLSVAANDVVAPDKAAQVSLFKDTDGNIKAKDSLGKVTAFASNQLVDGQDNITAFAGGGQASAVVMTKRVNRVTVVASLNDSIKLPVGVVGMVISIRNADATNNLNLFPQTGGQISDAGVNTAFVIANIETKSFVCLTNLLWYSVNE